MTRDSEGGRAGLRPAVWRVGPSSPAVRAGTLPLARKNPPSAPRVATRAGPWHCAAVTLQAGFT